ncbi:hypothetical protein BDP27DRAFT_1434410 [Rhodocollybia butyracea]|uniref:Uncharacterized protein n=1 Tax=Rhodocollybia butyracea TaxID=206335 RepID=A0A9P5P5F6_9AGAR|nr:hypothetical protein BDP27DRAFT_1434410 [Rhodocollybia butyracea]
MHKSMPAGTALVIACVSDIADVTPENLVVFSHSMKTYDYLPKVAAFVVGAGFQTLAVKRTSTTKPPDAQSPEPLAPTPSAPISPQHSARTIPAHA